MLKNRRNISIYLIRDLILKKMFFEEFHAGIV
jgi:hypothetical protein